MKALTIGLALVVMGAIHFELPELGACAMGFILFTINTKES